MPYRHPPTGPACACHPAATTVTKCSGCLEAVCAICVSYPGWQARCRDCAKTHLRRSARVAIAVQAALFVLVCSVGLSVGFVAGAAHVAVEPLEPSVSDSATYILCSISSTR